MSTKVMLCVVLALSCAFYSESASVHSKDTVIRQIFSFDWNEDGLVNGMELYRLLTTLDGQLGYSPTEARTIIQIADQNKDNQLDITELMDLAKLAWTESLQH